jgi:nicotinamidase-related amidase
MCNKVLVLIDVISDYLAPEGSFFIGKEAEKIVKNIKENVMAARTLETPVIFAKMFTL